MVVTIFNGYKLSLEKEKRLKKKFQQLSKAKQGMKLVDILVGNDQASRIYAGLKRRVARGIGINFEVVKTPSAVNSQELIDLVKKLNRNNKVAGIMFQLPLPGRLKLNQEKIIDAIKPDKDVDCLTSYNLGRLLLGQPLVLPATARAIWQILMVAVGDEKSILGKKVVVVGRSNIVGKPITLLLVNKGATVTVCHRRTRDLANCTRGAEILISATGQPDLITKRMVKNGSIVIDVGSPRSDTDFDQIKDKVAFITPVPGGVGPVTVTCLLENFLNLLS